LHFVTGGTHNGKSNWVKAYYKEQGSEPDVWLSAYNGDVLPDRIDEHRGQLIIVEGLEQFVRQCVIDKDLNGIREFWQKLLLSWQKWEKLNELHRLVLIGTDISKGIVPLERENRRWRDLTGWIYQDITQISNRVDIIWYGLNTQLK
jgi:adenosylcobinamide kinase / adenosylcobinamide-phosphate guanylyltransferase